MAAKGKINPEDGSKGVFVHISPVGQPEMPGLKDGYKVTFAAVPDKRGKSLQAIDLPAED